MSVSQVQSKTGLIIGPNLGFELPWCVHAWPSVCPSLPEGIGEVSLILPFILACQENKPVRSVKTCQIQIAFSGFVSDDA